MSDLILPKRVVSNIKEEAAARSMAHTAIHALDSDDFVRPDEVTAQLAKLQSYVNARREEEEDYHLPRPVGWKLVVLMLTIPDESAGGVIIVDNTKEARAISSPQGVVLDVGVATYSDPARFAVDGVLKPWCKIGDRITMIKYDASLFQLANGQRIGFLNDTQPIACLDENWIVPT